LAVSRDGINWVRIKDEVPLIPNGVVGAFDAGDVWPSNYPMVEGSDLWIYYSGTDLTLAAGDGHSSMGRCRVRLDGFAKMCLSEGQSEGSLTTVPFQIQEGDAGRLMLNVEHLAEGKGSLKVEVLDGTTGEAIPGYSAEECNPLSKDGISLPVAWRNKDTLSGIGAKSIRLRFVFSGDEKSPRLCSFGFE
jgi:hypothetical protein